METGGKIRIDKWLWAVRAFKTRSKATQACKSGQVAIGGIKVKPSRTIAPGDLIELRKEGQKRTLKVIGILENRVGAPRVAEFMKDLTPATEIAANLKSNREAAEYAKTTSRDRRRLRQFLDEQLHDDINA